MLPVFYVGSLSKIVATPALLALEDGTLFHGASIGACGQSVGEVVFNTAMTGYQEILTDPSYCRQIITLTYPHIGNVGANAEDEESARVYGVGVGGARFACGVEQLASAGIAG